MNEFMKVCNKAQARMWHQETTMDGSYAWTKRDLVLVVRFDWGNVYTAILYRDGKILDRIISEQTHKLEGTFYLLERL